jgi:hypothetical protein
MEQGSVGGRKMEVKLTGVAESRDEYLQFWQ